MKIKLLILLAFSNLSCQSVEKAYQDYIFYAGHGITKDADIKEQGIDNIKTGTEYPKDDEQWSLTGRKFVCMPESFFKLFYFELWSLQAQKATEN